MEERITESKSKNICKILYTFVSWVINTTVVISNLYFRNNILEIRFTASLVIQNWKTEYTMAEPTLKDVMDSLTVIKSSMEL